MTREDPGSQFSGSMEATRESFWPIFNSTGIANKRRRLADHLGSRPFGLVSSVGLFVPVVAVGMLLLLPLVFSRGTIIDGSLKSLEGAWQEEAGARVVHIEPERIVEFDGRELVVRGIVSRQGDRLILRKSGLKENWQASLQGAMLRLEHGGNTSTFRRLDRLPSQVRVEPLPVASFHEIPSQEIESICKEIERRFTEEQALLKDPARENEIAVARQSNLEYLRQLLATAGWVDDERYGLRTSFYALILAKHTEDLRLMLTVLPYADDVFKKSGKAQAFAILYDAVQLDMGRKQRYGTQVMEDEVGPFLLPLEDPDQVNRYLADLGLPPLESYIGKVESYMYNGRKVRLVKEDR